MSRVLVSAQLTVPNLLLKSLSSSVFHALSGFEWRLQGEQDPMFPRRTRSRAIHVLANPNTSSLDKEKSKKQVVMVDPLEAKRLASKQMEQIQAKEKFKKRCQIEAIKGAWAMTGLMA